MADAKTELAEIKRDGATPRPNSGRGSHKKGDATLGPFLVDYKEYKKSFGITEDVWSKISTDAVTSVRMQPALKLVLGENNGQKTRLWVIGDKMFHEMLEAWEEKYEVQD